jgi:hypothetical protein
MTTKANAFADLMKEVKGRGVSETERADDARPVANSTVKPKRQGKREHHDYGKIGVYIRMETITEVKTKLVRERRELSDLVQELLDKWLAGQTTEAR